MHNLYRKLINRVIGDRMGNLDAHLAVGGGNL